MFLFRFDQLLQNDILFLFLIISNCIYYKTAVYLYITDMVSYENRSFRITFFVIIESVATLSATLVCGYVIKYVVNGFLYLFVASAILSAISLLYCVLVLTESLGELDGKTIWQRLKTCSPRHCLKIVTIYFTPLELNNLDDEGQETIAKGDQESLLPKKTSTRKKNTFALFTMIGANSIVCFVQSGTKSIFTLFLMDYPLCFDSIARSNYSIFSQAVSIVLSSLVSKLLRINDMLICMLAVGTYATSFLCLVFGKSTLYIYICSILASLVGLQYGFVKSAVSKSMNSHEVADALSSGKTKIKVFLTSVCDNMMSIY